MTKGKEENGAYKSERETFEEKQKRMIPIKKGCPLPSCYCTGECEEIVDYRYPEPGEIPPDGP